MPTLNSTVLDAVLLQGSNDYQQRVPSTQQAGYHAAIRAIFDSPQTYNEFTQLLNYVSAPYVEERTFRNPLRDLKKPMGPTAGAHAFGGIERHIAAQWFRAHTDSPDSEVLLKFEAPEYEEYYYSTSPSRKYMFSWAFDQLSRAFAEDGNGFADLLNATLGAMISSDEYDEMNIMIQTIAEADQVGDGIFAHTLSAAPTTQATAQELFAAVRAYAYRFRFPSRLYNMLPVPSFVRDTELVFWCTPEVMANLDVFGLATLFNMDKAEIRYRIIIVPEFPVSDMHAMLTSEDFVYCRDYVYSLEQPFYNPDNRTTKYWLHHAETVGFNPYVPAVKFITA